MTVPRSVADVLVDHVTLEVECIDRIYLNVYVPNLQFVGGIVHFLREHRGHRFASSALLEPISRGCAAGAHTGQSPGLHQDTRIEHWLRLIVQKVALPPVTPMMVPEM